MKATLILFLISLLLPVQAASIRPNIILVMTDDQGYGDLACHGHPFIRTPNLDDLHRESTRFTDFQVSPTCSPTRAALLSGKHPFKNGVTHTILERERMALSMLTAALMGDPFTVGRPLVSRSAATGPRWQPESVRFCPVRH